ncbi:MAG: hypothetical protein ABEL04_07890 [Salinibacter sp.]|uniref:hypothetical protein n=1 Tax=Salinibacter sp. TaxID=2065818 RepID=UPI0035D3E5AF
MKRFLPLLAVVVGLLAMPIAATAQQIPFFSRPTVAVRTGAVQTVSENTGGLAPYVEVQSRVCLGETPFGLALYGGLSYEQLAPHPIICITGPCLQGWQTYLDLATGLRVGVFPRRGPVSAFVGFAPHLLRRTREGTGGDEKRWVQYSTVEAGASVQIPITSHLGVGAGVRGDFSLLFEEEGLLELGRYGVHLGVQYEL